MTNLTPFNLRWGRYGYINIISALRRRQTIVHLLFITKGNYVRAFFTSSVFFNWNKEIRFQIFKCRAGVAPSWWCKMLISINGKLWINATYWVQMCQFIYYCNFNFCTLLNSSSTSPNLPNQYFNTCTVFILNENYIQ